MHQQLALRPLRSMALVTQLNLELSKLTSALSVRLICAGMAAGNTEATGNTDQGSCKQGTQPLALS